MISNRLFSRICLLTIATLLTACTTSRHTVDDSVTYYIGKLSDPAYVETYGGKEHPRPWYTAAEALGNIGKPAVPALISRLDTSNDYELMLALYALMLATQDPVLMAETQGDYLLLDSVLTQESNHENRLRALEWWTHHRDLWH